MSPNAIITHVENTEKNLIFNDGNGTGGGLGEADFNNQSRVNNPDI